MVAWEAPPPPHRGLCPVGRQGASEVSSHLESPVGDSGRRGISGGGGREGGEGAHGVGKQKTSKYNS